MVVLDKTSVFVAVELIINCLRTTDAWQCFSLSNCVVLWLMFCFVFLRNGIFFPVSLFFCFKIPRPGCFLGVSLCHWPFPSQSIKPRTPALHVHKSISTDTHINQSTYILGLFSLIRPSSCYSMCVFFMFDIFPDPPCAPSFYFVRFPVLSALYFVIKMILFLFFVEPVLVFVCFNSTKSLKIVWFIKVQV